jgi:peptide-methionine (R)-S-oxide reductase
MKDGEIKNKLSPAQVSVMLHRVTEPPYFGKFWDHFEAGTYRCAACDTALFSSDEKFDSRTGWPSFKKPIHERDLQFKSEAGPDDKVELRCKKCKGHLGYVISGETPYYRINSVCLQFEPRPVPPPTPAVAAVEEKPAAEKKTIIPAPAMLEIEPVEVGTSWSTSSLIEFV